MLSLPTRIYIATMAVDMRRGHDGLAAMAREYVKLDPLEGCLFVFFNRRVDRVKALWWDETGYCLLYKRLERGRFRVPQPLHVGAPSVKIEMEELLSLFKGVRLPERKVNWRG